MLRKPRPATVILVASLLFLTTIAPGQAPKNQPTTTKPTQQPSANTIMNGTVHVAKLPCTSNEFPPDWKKVLHFAENPQFVCVRWSSKSPTVWAKWNLYKVIGNGPDEKVGSGDVPAATLGSPISSFQIPVQPALPQFNTASTAQKYNVIISSKKANNDRVYSSLGAVLVHDPKPALDNPYNCTSGPTRRVELDLPWMVVNRTSNTPGDGDRDELYFHFKWKKGGDGGVKRLPSADDYYEAKNGKDTKKGFTNRNELHTPRPVFWSGLIKHGETLQVDVNAMEQDNSDLKSIKAGIIAAMAVVAAVAAATGTIEGAIVASVAGGVAGLTAAFVPDTDGHDQIGWLRVRVKNQCGYIQVVWVTKSEIETEGDDIKNEFKVDDNLEGIESHLIVHDTRNLFWPNGVDWGGHTPAGLADEFWWDAAGTSNSDYSFRLRSKVIPPN
jgi:hypothetical protein